MGDATAPDQSCEIGTTACATRNTIGDSTTANDIGNGTPATWGIKALNQAICKIYNNDVSNVTSTGAGNPADGIWLEFATPSNTTLNLGTSELYNNKITAISCTNTGTTAGQVARGIRVNLNANAGSIARVYNNFISNIQSATTNATLTTRKVIGINLQPAASGAGSTINCDFNSVSINATTLGNSNACLEIGIATGPAMKVRNNILSNTTAAQSGSAKHYCWITSSATSIGATGSISNYNDLYVANTNGFVGLANTTDKTALSDWQGVATNDANSKSVLPEFTSAIDLHSGSAALNGAADPSFATNTSWVTLDIDCATRPSPTDIGADEFTPVTPTITLSTNTVAAGNIALGSTNTPIYSFAIGVTTSSATLTGLTATTGGTYLSADVTNLKAWYQTSVQGATFTGTGTLLSTKTTPGDNGTLVTFPTFTSQPIANGATGYIFITADLPCTATLTNSISINAITASNTTFALGTPTGTPAAGNAQAIITGTVSNVTGQSAASASGTSATVTWTNPTSCFTEIMIVAAPATNTGTPTGNGTAYTANLAYGSGTGLGNGFVVYKGSTSPQTITALVTDSPYFFKIFTRLGTSWSTGVEVSATPLYCNSTVIPTCTTCNAGDIVTNVVVTNSLAGTLTQASTNNANYIDIYNNTPLDLVRSSTTNTVAITFGTDGTQHSAVWIDFNQNGLFDAAENVALSSTSAGASSTVTYTFTVPGTALLGKTKIRIRGASDSVYTSGGACTNSTYGETEDYWVNIIVPTTPTITLSDNAIAAGNIAQGSTNNPIYSFAIAVTTSSATLTGLTATTGGTYLSADVTNLKAWYQTSAQGATFTGTGTLLSTKTTPGANGTTVTFPTFTSNPTIANGATGYIFITADLPCTATTTNTISITGIAPSNTTFALGTAGGSASAGNGQTITAGTPVNATGVSAAVASSVSATVAWTAPTGCYTEIMIVAAPAANTGTPTGDGTAYTANLAYGSGTGLGNGFVVYKGTVSPQTISALTNLTTYYFKVYTRYGTNWSSGVEVNTFINGYCTASLHTGWGPDITNVTLNAINNSSTYAGTTPGYTLYPSSTATTTLFQGVSYTGSLTVGVGSSGYTGAITSVWIDYNKNGTFDSTEWVQPFTNATTGSFTVNVPVGASLGTTLMRVRARGNGNANGSTDACTSFASGETEDYVITIATPPAPTITSLGSSSGCSGTSITINGTNLSGAVASGVTIGGTAVTSITSNSGTVLVAVVGAGTTGTVSVTTPGGTATGDSFTVFPLPTATWSATATSVCFNSGAQTTSLSYSVTTNTPVSYSITWNASPTNSFVAVTDQATTFSAPGTITLNVPAGTAVGTYTGTIKVKNANGCVSSATQTFTITVNPTPTTTWAATATPVCFNTNAQTTPLAYTATTNSPTTYSITWNGTPSNSFATVTDASFAGTSSGGTISIAVPAGTTANTYSGTITVKSANSCVSASSSFTVTVNALPGATASSNSPVCEGSPLTLSASPNSQAGYVWTGPLSYTNSVTQTVTQNFNTLGTGAVTWTDNSTLPGWYLLQGQGTGTSTSPATAVASLTADSGSGVGPAVYNYANTTTTSDRALGGVPTNGVATAGSLAYFYGVKVTNTTGATATTVAVTYTGEQYRNSGVTPAHSLTVDYSLNATALTTASGTWNAISALTFTSPITGGTAGSLDGNATANKVTGITTTLTGLSIPNNSSIWIRWTDTNETNGDHGLAIDDVSITLTANSGQNPTVTSTAVSGNEGTYNLTVTNSNGCTSTASTVVVVNSPSTAAVISGTASTCGGSTDLSVAITGGTSPFTVVYTDGSSNFTVNSYTSGTAIPVSPTSTKTYTLVSVTSTGGCVGTSNSGSAVVTVNPRPTSVISGTQTLCYGNTSSNLSIAMTGTQPWSLTYTDGTTPITVSGITTSPYTFTVSPTSTKTYTVSALSDANCTSQSGDRTGSAVVTVSNTNTWTGGASSSSWLATGNWSCGSVPTSTTDVVIASVLAGFYPVIASDVSISSLTINSGTTLNVATGVDLTVTNAIVNSGGTLTIENNANLMQSASATANTNSGNVVVKRNSSALKRLDYTLWSSPVTGQGVYAFSKFTFPGRFYVYDEANNNYNNALVGLSVTGLQYPSPLTVSQPEFGVDGTDSAGVTFDNGKGYLIRVPYNHPTTPAVYEGTFTGVANNGNISAAVAISPGLNKGFNAVGNPYPSRLNVHNFIDGNTNITGTLYFWRKTNTTAVSGSYATLTKTAYTANGSAGGDTGTGFFPTGGNQEQSWVLNIGQGFIVRATSGSTVSFTNSMRRSLNADQFFKNNTTVNNVTNGLYWLNLTDNTGVYSQMAVGYSPEGTVGFDRGIDGENINKEFYLTSLIDAGEYSIQGRPDFDSNDVVPLSYKALTAGNYSISIDHTDGLFTDVSQPIYVKDILTDTYHDLNTGAYAFDTAAGTFANRFEIVYALPLGVGNPTFTANQVIIYNQNNEFVVKSGTVTMESIKVFDIRGRLLEEKKGINANQTTIGGGLANEVLLVQITSVDGVTVTKKVVR